VPGVALAIPTDPVVTSVAVNIPTSMAMIAAPEAMAILDTGCE
jgi:hypothetical protein